MGNFLCKTIGGGFKYFLFSPLPGEMIQFDKYFSDGLKPPTSNCWGLTLWETSCIKKITPPERQKFAEKTMHLKSAELDIVLVNNKTGTYAAAFLQEGSGTRRWAPAST